MLAVVFTLPTQRIRVVVPSKESVEAGVFECQLSAQSYVGRARRVGGWRHAERTPADFSWGPLIKLEQIGRDSVGRCTRNFRSGKCDQRLKFPIEPTL